MLGAPATFERTLGGLPDGARPTTRGILDFALLFARSASELRKYLREYGLGAGLVDVKICAVDETWSGLKFVRRLKDRPTTRKT